MPTRVSVDQGSADSLMQRRDRWELPNRWDDFDLIERLITAVEFASMLGVGEDDVLEWILAGHIPYVEGRRRGAPGSYR